MNLVYFAHSYRKEDAPIVKFFGQLMRSTGLIPSLDPPSDSVNAAKLERHLTYCDGMVAVLTRREGGVSPHILFEIGLCLWARKPLVVFIEDVLPGQIVPDRVLQRRFSRKSFLREVRQHRHALQIFQGYLGENPPPRYQPPAFQRSCLVIGVNARDAALRKLIVDFCKNREYRTVDLGEIREAASHQEEIREHFAAANLVIAVLDARSAEAAYLLGLTTATFVPCISLTPDPDFQFQLKIPREYQPRIIDAANLVGTERVLTTELDIFEEDFLELDNQKEVEQYSALLIDIGSSKGEYQPGTREEFVQIIMGDQYKTGQAGAVGPGSHAHDMTFKQVWQESEVSKELPTLAEQLGVLRNELLKDAISAEHYSSIGAVASAETEATKGNGPKALEYLSSAGKWALDVASKVGTSVAAAAIKEAMGIK
ncbi:MAG: hypothetical protein JOY92_15810 [Verrucomicrobia bacterium]|nr:hypothetical protein [Verrucomicrobiota bacterium]